MVTEQKQPRKPSGLLSFILGILALFFAFKAITDPEFILAAMLSIFFSCIIRAYSRGIVTEAFSILRLIGTFALSWHFAEEAGKALNLPGILASITGFYLLFLLSFAILGKIISMITANSVASIPSRLLGAFVGAFEGLILAWVLLIAVYSVPNSKLSDYYPQFFSQFTGPVEKMLAPVLPDKANTAVQAVKTAQKLIKGFDPEKVDRQALQEVLTPIAEMPEIVAIREDAELQKLIVERNFKGLLNNKTMRNLLESKELQTKVVNMDWKKLEKALSAEP